MRKRILVLTFLAVFALTGCASLLPQRSRRSNSSEINESFEQSSSDEKTSSRHVHRFSSWETTKEPTCTEDGQEVSTCECGEQKFRTKPAFGHDFVDIEEYNDPYYIKPTEYTVGQRSRQCTRCGAYEIVEIPRINGEHNYEEVFNRYYDEGSITTHYMKCADCDNCAIRWNAIEYNRDLTIGTVNTKSLPDGNTGIRFGTVQYSNGDNLDAGTHIFYKIYSPVFLRNAGLSFSIQTHSAANGYAIFDNYSGETNWGYEYNQNGELVQSTKRYGLRVNGQQVELGKDDTEGLYTAGQMYWIKWPVSIDIVQGFNTFEFYGLGGYRPYISMFQINGYGPEILDGASTSGYSVNITNKDELNGSWLPGISKSLYYNITLNGADFPNYDFRYLTITSSDESIIKVSGNSLKALKPGTANVTISYQGAKASIAITVSQQHAKSMYGTEHDGGIEDPLSNEDALIVAKSENYLGESYYVKGIVDRFYNAPGSRADGMVAFYLKPAIENGEQFEIYKCFKEDGTGLSDDDIWAGGEVIVYGSFGLYNTQYETISAVFVSCEGNKPEPRQIIEKPFNEVLAVGAALKDGDVTYNYYKFQGYVSFKEGNNYFLTATKGEGIIQGISDEAHGSKTIPGTNAIELYRAGLVAELANKLLKDAKVEVTMLIKNYHGTVENGKDLVDADVTVIEAGSAWDVPEPTVAYTTLADFINLPNVKTKAYYVTATIKSWKDATAEKDKYGNMILTDGENDLIIYGSSATESVLIWDNISLYKFSNVNDFLTNEVTAALKIGDFVTMKLIRSDYIKDGVTTIQATGVVVSVRQ